MFGISYGACVSKRAGDPLLEIVFEPDMRNGIEAAEYTGEMRRILRHILNIFQFCPTVK